VTNFSDDEDYVCYFQFDESVILFDRFQLSTKKQNEKYVWSEEIQNVFFFFDVINHDFDVKFFVDVNVFI
jgi:hypothetical protein